MKKALTLAVMLCLLLAGCTEKQSFSESFACGEAYACAVCDEGLLTASHGSAKLFDGSGNVVFERKLDAGNAAAVKNGSLAAVYVRGGRDVVFSDAGSIRTENGIICADLSESGYLAVCTGQPGYMGSVTVYSDDKKAVYKWYCASERLISAAVSPGGRCLAALTDEGVHLFSLDSEAERGVFQKPELSGIVWLGDDVLCGIGENGVYSCDDKGRTAEKREFKGKVTGKFGVLDKKLIIEVREHSAGGAGDVYILDAGLDIKERISPDGEVWSLDCRDDEAAILTQNGVSIYSERAKLLLSESASGASAALLTGGGAVAVGGGSAWVIEK